MFTYCLLDDRYPLINFKEKFMKEEEKNIEGSYVSLVSMNKDARKVEKNSRDNIWQVVGKDIEEERIEDGLISNTKEVAICKEKWPFCSFSFRLMVVITVSILILISGMFFFPMVLRGSNHAVANSRNNLFPLQEQILLPLQDGSGSDTGKEGNLAKLSSEGRSRAELYNKTLEIVRKVIRPDFKSKFGYDLVMNDVVSSNRIQKRTTCDVEQTSDFYKLTKHIQGTNCFRRDLHLQDIKGILDVQRLKFDEQMVGEATKNRLILSFSSKAGVLGELPQFWLDSTIEMLDHAFIHHLTCNHDEVGYFVNIFDSCFSQYLKLCEQERAGSGCHIAGIRSFGSSIDPDTIPGCARM